MNDISHDVHARPKCDHVLRTSSALNAPQQCGHVDMTEPLGHAQIEDQSQNCACRSMPIHNVNAVFRATRYFRCSNDLPAMRHTLSSSWFQERSTLPRMPSQSHLPLLLCYELRCGAWGSWVKELDGFD